MLTTHKYFHSTKFNGLGGLVPGISVPLTFTVDGSDIKCQLFGQWETTTVTNLIGQVQLMAGILLGQSY
jgi:hypothetical protein